MEEIKLDLEHDPIDGKFTLDVSASFSEAKLTVTSPFFGGKAITVDEILRELTERSVIYGVNKDLIKEIVDKELYSIPHKISSWLAPINGIDGTITFLFEKKAQIIPKEDANGFVNYKDLGLIRNTKAGTIIADITLPTDGTPGIDIRNIPVAQKKGVPANTTHGENIGISGDGTQMLALTDGNLNFLAGKFAIETVFSMRGDVDAGTGNLDFIGDIIVRGEVHEGFKVSSQKSITLYENVTGAVIEAGGNVIIKKGCINTKIVSHGDVTIDFVENSNITCDGDLKAGAFITSTVYCGGALEATGRQGLIMGGKYTCLRNLTANSIGSKSYMATIITVGDNAIMLGEKADCEKNLSDLDLQIFRATQVIDFLTLKKKELGSIPPERVEMLNAAIKQKLTNQFEKVKVEARIKEILKYLENKQNLSIICKKELYPGTKITINDFVLQVKDKYQYCKIYLGEEGIVTETL